MQELNQMIKTVTTQITTFRLKDLIKAVRACKTAADERAVIAKESANIRTAFKEENLDLRHTNIAKLLYIHMLGYPAQWGQIECLKLTASPRFGDKRLGYLGIMLLLDENQETLTLVTNCLKNDMNNSNQFIVGLALCTMGNICSPEMSRDLSMEVERLLSSTLSYVRKKAALCALRIIKKVPDLMENYIQKAIQLLNERNHAVLMTGVTLLIDMCSQSPEVCQALKPACVAVLIRHLKTLSAGGSHSAEHDVGGISDPFLQIKILRLLRLLGKGDATSSDSMNDVLAQVATNTEASKNVGNSILYETVLTIMDIQSESSLKVLGINILGRFLANKDNNIRYVALTTLTKTSATAAVDSSALQRHRSTILDCLKDPDISIRRKALDLSFYLITTQNIRILTRELLSFLEVCETDIKSTVASKICDVAGRYRPNKRWEIDTVVRVLRVAGSWVDQRVVNILVKLTSTGPADIQAYTVCKLFSTIKNGSDKVLSQEGILLASVWCIGEYGHMLKNGVARTEPDEDDTEENSSLPPSEREVVDFLSVMMRGPYASPLVKEYTLTSLVKLTSRFKEPSVVDSIKGILFKYRANMDIEIQQRSVEYSQFWSLSGDQRVALLEAIPVLESASKEEGQKGLGADPSFSPSNDNRNTADLIGGDSKPVVSKPKDDLYDLMFGGDAPVSQQIMDLFGTAAPIAASKPPVNNMDLLGDLFGGGPSKPPVVSQQSSNLDDLFGTTTQAQKAYTCYTKNNLLITLTPTRIPSTTTCSIVASFSNSGSPISNLSFQVAVPKTLKLQMDPISSTTVSGNVETQVLKIENPGKEALRLKLKISYVFSGGNADDVVVFNGFDASLWQ